MKKIQYIKNYLDILFISEKFALLRVIFVARFSNDNLKKKKKLDLFINIYYIIRGNSVIGAYDDLKRNNLLNSNKEKITRTKIRPF
jgi:hypothetical protein